MNTENLATSLVPSRERMILCLEEQDENRTHFLERIEVIMSYKNGKRYLKICCIPESESDDGIPGLSSVLSDDSSSVMSDTAETPPVQNAAGKSTTFVEELARIVLDPCQCQSFLKPALRKEPRPASSLGRRSVSFDTVDIKEFPMTLGDHPSAASGPPVTLDWEKIESERCVALDDYEASRTPRRSRRQLKLSLRDRKGILQKQFSAAEVNKAWQEARQIREQRRETIQRGMMMMFLDDMVETTNRRVGKIGETFSSMILFQ